MRKTSLFKYFGMQGIAFVTLFAGSNSGALAQTAPAGVPELPSAPERSSDPKVGATHWSVAASPIPAFSVGAARPDFSTMSLSEYRGAAAHKDLAPAGLGERNFLPQNSTQTPDYYAREDSLNTAHQSSSYVPLDSWVYPVLDRLAAMGYSQTGSQMVRPLTRLECARLLAEAHANTDPDTPLPEPLLFALDEEFAYETSVIDGKKNVQANVESIYARFTGIEGTPLRDSFHFGQTLADDYGRPYGEGKNAIAGFSQYTQAGRFSLYMRGEYQYASPIPAYSLAAQQVIARTDQINEAFLPPTNDLPLLNLSTSLGTTNRVRPIEAYASVNFANWQISFGQQSLWWGPDRTTSLMLSNNAESLPMLRVARVKPIKMPQALSRVGPVHFDAFFARQGGIHYVGLGPMFVLYGNSSKALTPPPYLWGVNFSLEPTANLEIGFSHTVIFAGYGRPLNLKTFFHSFSVDGNGQDIDPGKRVTQFDFYYHVPGLRKSFVVYTEGMAWDNPVQGSFFSRFAMDPGVYLPQLPGLKKMDLRLEGVYTDLPGLKYTAYFYANAHYPQGYTNYGQVMGSWIGRQGFGGQASTTYWFSARTKATVSFRRMSQDKAFLQGGDLKDFSGSLIWTLRPGTEFSVTSQYENTEFPLLASGTKSNFATTFQIRIFPKTRLGSR